MPKLALTAYLLIEAFLTLAVGSWLGPGPDREAELLRRPP
jgi:hypothetical protein